MSRNLQVPWWKSGVTSHSKNWQIWFSPWGGDALQYLMQLVATPDFDPPFVQGHIFPFLLVTCLWNLFSLSQLLNLVVFIQIFTHVKFAVCSSSQYSDVSLNSNGISHSLFVSTQHLVNAVLRLLSFLLDIIPWEYRCAICLYNDNKQRAATQFKGGYLLQKR